jgi:hypothetical protein
MPDDTGVPSNAGRYKQIPFVAAVGQNLGTPDLQTFHYTGSGTLDQVADVMTLDGP